MASSIHQLAVILGEDLATKDLVPVFNGFIKDLDEVRIGALKHLAEFLKVMMSSMYGFVLSNILTVSRRYSIDVIVFIGRRPSARIIRAFESGPHVQNRHSRFLNT